jgi:hypothetical protein
LEQEDSAKPFSDNLNRLLKDLVESASMLEAEKFLQWYAHGVAESPLARAQGQALLKVLQELEGAVQARVPPQPDAAPPASAAVPPPV